jgi:hypothetical protein
VRKPAAAKRVAGPRDRWTATVGNQFVDSLDKDACYLITELRGGWCGAVLAATGQPSDDPAKQWWGAAALEQRAAAKAHESKKTRALVEAPPPPPAEAAPAAESVALASAVADAPGAASAVAVPPSPADKMRRITTMAV